MLEKNLEEFRKAKNPFGKLIEYYVNLRHGAVKSSYLKTKSKTMRKGKINTDTARAWIHGDVPFPTKYLKGFVEELQIPLEEINKVNNGKNPFEPDIEEFKKAKNPLGRLVDYYLYNQKWPRKHCLSNNETIIKNKIKLATCRYWIRNDSFPIKYLKSFVEELKIPLEKVIELNGKNPFEPDIEDFKKAKNPLGRLADYYINLRHGIPIFEYFKDKSKAIKRNNLNPATAEIWVRGQKYYLKHIKGIVEELKIPLEKVIELNGKNPFKPDLEEFKKAKNPLGELIEFYVDLKYGMCKLNYLKNKSVTIKKDKLNPYTVLNWTGLATKLPLKHIKSICNELQIPLEEIIKVNNKNPFKPDLKEFKRDHCPIGRLIDFYIDLRYGAPRERYLKSKSRTVKKEKLNIGTAIGWVNGGSPFPLKYLKNFVDELKIPYNEVNYLINGDIEKGIARAGNVSIEPSTEMILDSVKYYIQQYKKGQKERPAVFYPKKHSAFEEKHGISTRQIYRSLNK